MKTVLVATDVNTTCWVENYLKVQPVCECVCVKNDRSIGTVYLPFLKAESVKFMTVGIQSVWRVWYLFECTDSVREFLSCRLWLPSPLSGEGVDAPVNIKEVIFPLTRGQQ